MAADNFDLRDFRRALSQFPTGVTVITTVDAENQPIGVTASSFNSVSLDPPLILWSVDKSTYSLEAFRHAEYFIVNVLSRDQVDISNRFASRGEDKFAGVTCLEGLGGCPMLENVAAQFECKTWAVYEGGDHLIQVGEVIKYRYADEALPLVYAQGSYAVSAIHPEMMESESAHAPGEFVSDYLLYLLRETYSLYSEELYPKMKQQCEATPEEWRILVAITDQGSMDVKSLSEVVMQPKMGLTRTLDWMLSKGHVQRNADQLISLTEQGVELANQLLGIAKSHESELLSALTGEQATALKDCLKTILKKHS